MLNDFDNELNFLIMLFLILFLSPALITISVILFFLLMIKALSIGKKLIGQKKAIDDEETKSFYDSWNELHKKIAQDIRTPKKQKKFLEITEKDKDVFRALGMRD